MSGGTRGYRTQMRLVRTTGMRVWIVLLTAALLYVPWVVSDKSLFGLELSKHALLNINMTTLNTTILLLIGALGLNLVTGYTGLISIGNAGFFALGAIVTSAVGIIGMFGVHWPFTVAILVAGVAGAVVGALVGLPALRIRGIYLLLATLGFHYVMSYAFREYQLTYFTEGGVIFDRPAKLWPFDYTLSLYDIRWYYFLLGFAIVSFLLVKNLLRSRQGRALLAVRDQEIAAGMAGIDVARMRIVSFSVSSALITMAGGAYAWYLGAAEQGTYPLLFAITFIAIIVVGGEGSLVGTVLGAILWQLVPRALEAGAEMSGSTYVTQWQTQITLIIFGVLIVLVMIFQPTGLAGIWARVKRAFVRWPYTT
jgi:branched-chain amino acid transport system permease protein